MMVVDTDIKDLVFKTAKYSLAKRNYADYFLLANPSMELYPHTKLITEKLQKIADGEQHFYIISMPPQHGKSLTITKTFPSYYLMKHPDKHAMIVAYSQDLYSQFATSNRRAFNLWSSRLFQLKIGKNTSQTFDIQDHRGGFYATSVLGGATGMSADLLIIDDPMKNAEEANSMTVKTKIWDEWNLTFYPRLQKGGSVIVIMTRWQTDDLAGRLLQRSSLPWEEIKLPAIATDIPAGQTDAIGRHNGEALCPELHSLDELLTHKHDMGTQKFTALYQQSPTIEDGNIFKREWIRYYVPDKATQVRLQLTDKDAIVIPKYFDETVQAWDATFKSKENDDFVAGQTWSRRGADCFMMPAWCHKRLSFTETLDAIRAMSRQYPQAVTKLVEDKANGPAIIDTLKREIPGIVPVSPGTDSKEARAASVSPVWEAGNIYVPHPLWKPQIEDWLEEIFGFPNMPHDDNVDSMVYAVRRLTGRNRGPVIRY
ncbi:phage terminase large subunit [Lactobacillus amylolyticus]|uniref:phage terminase large subunit n=1 Tax=Lactobacillus amylolyticus TaxID=83683 RepID=UPI0024930BE8|nr:phage terminase large subunit [Lactobacillus amylolyticus]